MSKTKWIVVAVLAFVILLVGSLLILEFLGPMRSFELIVSGQPGREVVGVVTVDGKPQDVEGTLPLTLKLQGRRITFMMANRDGKPPEDLAVEVNMDGRLYMRASSSRGVKGEVYRPVLLGGMRQRSYISGLGDAEAAALTK